MSGLLGKQKWQREKVEEEGLLLFWRKVLINPEATEPERGA